MYNLKMLENKKNKIRQKKINKNNNKHNKIIIKIILIKKINKLIRNKKIIIDNDFNPKIFEKNILKK